MRGAPELEESELVSAVLEEADCGLLLDVNNVYVNSKNHGFSASEYIARLDAGRVWQLHVAGHEHRAADGLIVDTHGADVIAPVYELLRQAVARTGPVPVVLERDSAVPDLDTLLAERRRLQACYELGLTDWRARHVPVAALGTRDAADGNAGDANRELRPVHGA